MGQSAEELTQGIEETRHNLSRDVDELSDKVSPSRIVARRKDAARSRMSSVAGRIMGTASSARDSVASVGGTVTGSASSAAGSASSGASSAVDTLEAKAEGNPLAAGLIAFGAGVLISSLVPASEKETQAARAAVDAAKEHGQPVLDEVKSVGQEIGEQLKDSAVESAHEVKATAQESMETVKAEGQSSAETMKTEANPNT